MLDQPSGNVESPTPSLAEEISLDFLFRDLARVGNFSDCPLGFSMGTNGKLPPFRGGMGGVVQKVIEDPLSEEILKGRFKGANKIRVLLEAGTPVFVASEDAPVLSGVS